MIREEEERLAGMFGDRLGDEDASEAKTVVADAIVRPIDMLLLVLLSDHLTLGDLVKSVEKARRMFDVIDVNKPNPLLFPYLSALSQRIMSIDDDEDGSEQVANQEPDVDSGQ